MQKEIIRPDAVRARALGFALEELSHDELCYRLAGLSIVNEELSKLIEVALAHAENESYTSGVAKRLMEALTPLLEQGKRFTAGRKPRTGSPVRKAIAKHLTTNPALKNAEIWDAIKSKPPRGWTAFDSNRVGKYIEGPKSANMNYERFTNVCSEERKKILPKTTG